MAGSHRRYRLPPILPVPHRIDPQPGRCLLSPASPVRSEFDDPRVARLAEAICRGSRQESDGASVPDLVLARNEPSDMATQGYRLDVVPRRVTVTASDAPGCFYGLQTLKQMA
ncbi:MAG: glycoside hydrolase family 20 zincin-like fold domain-containing protein, partial [Phycisphaerae bacterium]